MSKALAAHLAEKESIVSKIVGKLEELSGFGSEDVRFMARAKNQTAQKIKSLGLDPYDTTGEELYWSLITKLKNDSKHIARSLNLKDTDRVSERADKLINLAKSCVGDSNVLALKQTAAKSLLRKNVSKKLMKQLNYRSLESMLKREPADELLAGALALETSSWLKSFAREVAKLKSSDFEKRELRFFAMDDRWDKLAESKRPVTEVPLIGSIALWPVEPAGNTQSLHAVVRLLQVAEIMEIDSFYLSANHFSPQFGRLCSQLFASAQYQDLSIDDHNFFDWSHLGQALEKLPSAMERLARIHPSMLWWQDSSHLAHLDKGVISLNLIDNLQSVLDGADYAGRYISNSVNSLKSELLKAYAGSPGVKNYLQAQFDDTLALSPEIAEPAMEFEFN